MTKLPYDHSENREQLLQRHMDGTASPEESAAAEQWLREHIADPAYDQLFVRLLERTAPDSDREQLLRAYARLDRMIPDAKPEPPTRRSWGRLLRIAEFAAAAAAVIVALFVWIQPRPATDWIVEYAELGQTREITLPDSTRIWLNAGSRVIYPSRFDSKTRQIHIDGEIFADVTKDPRHPFVVTAAGVQVRVLGTQFSVKAYAQDRNTEVALIEGSVAMRAGSDAKAAECTLTPGDLIRYNRTTGDLEAYRIDTETYGSWHDNHNLCFVDQALSDIAADLQRRFNVQIVIRDAELAQVQYYASFVNSETLDQILRTLNNNNAMRITRINDTIILALH